MNIGDVVHVVLNPTTREYYPFVITKILDDGYCLDSDKFMHTIFINKEEFGTLHKYWILYKDNEKKLNRI